MIKFEFIIRIITINLVFPKFIDVVKTTTALVSRSFCLKNVIHKSVNSLFGNPFFGGGLGNKKFSLLIGDRGVKVNVNGISRNIFINSGFMIDSPKQIKSITNS